MDADDLARELRSVSDDLKDTALMDRVLLVVVRGVVRVTPVKSGTLRRSITSRTMSPTEGTVGTNVVYARAVHDGMDPITIYPRNRKALYWKGASHPVKKVTIPKRKGQPFLVEGMDAARSDVDRELEAFGKHVLDGVG